MPALKARKTSAPVAKMRAGLRQRPRDTARPGDLLHDRAYDLIHRDIVGCDLEPGSEVTESALSESYGFGKAPIRSALVRLENQGLVRSLPRRGYLITPVTLKHVQDVFSLRLMLEPTATKLAAGHIDIGRMLALDKIVRDGYLPTDLASKHRFFDARREFQALLADAADNGMLARILRQCYDEFIRCFHVGMLLHLENISGDLSAAAQKYPYGSRVLVELGKATDEMVDALSNEDGERAMQANIRKIEASRTFIVDAIMSCRRIAETSIATRQAP